MTAHRTPLDRIDLHPAGWLDLGDGVSITRAPLLDRNTHGFARLGHGDAEAWCAAQGYRMPTAAELERLHRAAKYIAPVTLPTVDMLRAAGVATNDQGAIQRYRVEHMQTRSWCEQHDEAVWERLTDEGWIDEPVSNAGKHWIAGGAIYGWWQATGKPIQPVSYAHHAEPRYTDYATTVHVCRGFAKPARTKPGQRGEDVRAWQETLKAAGLDVGAIDGIHGTKTEAASVAYEAARAPRPAVIDIQARNYTLAGRTRVDWIVLHSTENAIRPGTARNVATWFGSANAPRASAHYVVGPDELIRCVPEADVAWAAPGANRQGIQLELVGQAARTDWLLEGDADNCGAAVLRRAAELVAELCRRWNIPIERLDADALRAGKRGITTHASVGVAFKQSDHVDPGMPNDRRWPWEAFLALVRSAPRSGGGTPLT